MAKLNTYEKAEQTRAKTSDVSFRFGENDKLQPAGFENLTPNGQITVVLKGTATSFSSGDEWEKGKRFTLRMDSCEILAPPRAVSMDDAIAAANAGRKTMKK
jgi:hypothetical protein